jgi:hypothetical protein
MEKRLKTFRLICLVASMLTLITGIIHVSSKLDRFCDPSAAGSDSPTGCFGPWLIWQRDGSGINDLNAHWRSIFTLKTSVVFDLWTPTFLAIVSIHMHVPALQDSSNSEWETGQFQFNAFFYLFTALFGAFGYCGNLGVLAGFMNVLASTLCLVASFT